MHTTFNKQLASGYEEAVRRVPDALKGEGFAVLTEIDVKGTLKNRLGVDFRRYKILGACNPVLAHEALSTTLAVGTMLPCNVVVYEEDDGKAMVQVVDPLQIALNADPRLARVAKTLRDKLMRVLERLT